MAEIREIEYRSWSEFRTSFVEDLFDGEHFSRGRYLFRGHRSAEWNLVTSLDRWARMLPIKRRLEISEELVDEFGREIMSHGVDQDNSSPMPRVEVIALGQHHGLPTRLLDWTTSPYVAAFFAYSELVRHGHPLEHSDSVAVFALDTKCDVWSSELGVSIVYVSGSKNLRLRNQEGGFTLSRTVFSTLEEYVQHSEGSDVALIKAIIPASEAVHAMSELDSMGINHSRLFPDVVGCALSVQMRIGMRELKFA